MRTNSTQCRSAGWRPLRHLPAGAGVLALSFWIAAPAMAGCLSGSVADVGEARLDSPGCQADAPGFEALAVGRNAAATASFATAVGEDARAADGGTTAIGNHSLALGSQATILGQDAGPDVAVQGVTNVGFFTGRGGAGHYSTAVGATPLALGNYSIAIGGGDGFNGGFGAEARGLRSIAVGHAAVATGVGSVAVGPSAGANPNIDSGFNSAFGLDAGQSVNGVGNLASGVSSGFSVVGNHNAAYGDGAGRMVIGGRNTALGRLSGQFVGTAASPADRNIAIGDGAGNGTEANRLRASDSIAIGTSAKGAANFATAIGPLASALGANSSAVGRGATASHRDSVAIGSTSVTDARNTVSVGAPGARRRITNVARAINPTDAVNLAQVEALIAARSTVMTAMVPGDPPGAGTNAGGMPGKRPRREEAGGADGEARAGRRAASHRSARTATAIASASCELTGAQVTTALGNQANTSSSFSPVRQSGVAFRQGGSGPGCVTVSFSAEVAAPGAALIELRAVLDGGVEASPGPVLFAEAAEGIASRAFNFVFPAVAPGAHRIELEFRNAGEPGVVRMGQRTTMVQFAR